MNSKFNKILAATLITAMILAIVPAFAQPSEPHAASAVWLEDSTLTGPVGTVLTVYCWANISQKGYTWQVTILHNDSKLKFISASHTVGDPGGWDYLDQRDYGPDMTPQSLTLTGPVTGTMMGKDYVQMGGTCLGDDFVPAGTVGSLFWAKFNVSEAPPKGGVMETDLDITTTYPVDTFMEDDVGGAVPFTPYNADYSMAWAVPPKPRLAVDPDYTDYGPDPPSAIGELFDVDVYIDDMDPAWWCHNVTLNLDWNTTIIEHTSIVIDGLWATWSWVYTPGVGVLDSLYIEVADPTGTVSGDVLIATITFNVTFQDTVPPRSDGDSDVSPLDIHTYELWDTTMEIPTNPEVDGEVEIFCLRTLPIPYFEVSSVTMGPEPCRCNEFNVTVSIKDLDAYWYTIGFEFRLGYDASLIEPVACYEGPFLGLFAEDHNDFDPPTWFISFFEPDGMYGPHVLVGTMILPNATGWWNATGPWPEGEGVVAIITFHVVYQSYGEPDLTCDLEILHQLSIDLDNPTDQNIVDSPLDTPVNGVYTITTDLPGRVIDLYGGALNEGHGSHPFPAPYGGQGQDNPMDMVVPQAEVRLFAEVTYNYWPMQNKIVSFEVEDPHGGILLKQTAVTNDVGIASIIFEMPWPCDDPESLFGKWNVTATVSISDVMVMDTLRFDYDYMVNIWKVTADKFEYDHCEEVEITIDYGTHAMQTYPVLFAVVILDELLVPIGMALVETEVGGAEFCSYVNFTDTFTIHIPKYAAAGIATIHVNAFDKDPTEGGVAWCPEYSPPTEIAIQPY